MRRIMYRKSITVRTYDENKVVFSGGYAKKGGYVETQVRTSIEVPEWSEMKPKIEQNPEYGRHQEFIMGRCMARNYQMKLKDVIIYNNKEYEDSNKKDRS